MEIIAAVALGALTYAYLDDSQMTAQEQPRSEYVEIVVKEEQPNVQWVFING